MKPLKDLPYPLFIPHPLPPHTLIDPPHIMPHTQDRSIRAQRNLIPMPQDVFPCDPVRVDECPIRRIQILDEDDGFL